LRAILSKMTVEEINSDRESFNEQVREVAQGQLDNMGFKITSLGLTNLKMMKGIWKISDGRKFLKSKRKRKLRKARTTGRQKSMSHKWMKKSPRKSTKEKAILQKREKRKRLKMHKFSR